MARSILVTLMSVLALPAVLGQQCAATLKGPLPPMLRCGAQKDATKRTSAFAPVVVTTVEDCANSCHASADSGTGICMSFTYNAGTCTRFRRTGPRLGLVPSIGGTQFYNVACFNYPQPTTLSPTDTFTLTVSSSDDSTIIGRELQRYFNGPLPELIAVNNVAPIARFTLSAAGTLAAAEDGIPVFVTGPNASINYGQGTLYYRDSKQDPGDEVPDCRVDPCSLELSCEVAGGSTFYTCNSRYEGLGTKPEDGCLATRLRVTDIQSSGTS